MHQYEALSSEAHHFEHSGEHSFTQRTKRLFRFRRFHMDIELPSWAAKTSWLLHFTFTSWALLSGFVTVQIYAFSQLIFLMVGIWNLADGSSAKAAILHFITILITILNDVIVLSIFTPRGYNAIENAQRVSETDRNIFRFAVIMMIANLLLKPCTAFLMFKAYNENTEEGFSLVGIFDSIISRFVGSRENNRDRREAYSITYESSNPDQGYQN